MFLERENLMEMVFKAAKKIRRRYRQDGWGGIAKSVARQCVWFRDKLWKRQLLTVNGVAANFFAPDKRIWAQTRSRHRREHAQIKSLLDELEPDDVFYDIGACTGLYTYFAVERLGPSQIIAFEPHPPNVEQLKKNREINDVQVRIEDVAVTNTVGSMNLESSSEAGRGYGKASLGSSGLGGERSTVVNTETLDHFVESQRVQHPNVIKIDVEGAEPLVIEGGEKVLRSGRCRTVYCEIHLPGDPNRPSIRDFGSTHGELLERMKEFGFEVGQKTDERGREFYKFVKT
jgi:FkbM family methyltransferase